MWSTITRRNNSFGYFEDLCFQTIGLFLPPANEVCEGYVSTGVCLSTGGCLPLVLGGVCHTPLGRHPLSPPDRHPQGRHPLLSACWDRAPSAQCMLWDTVNKQYASHWNAFLWFTDLTQSIQVGIYINNIYWGFQIGNVLTQGDGSRWHQCLAMYCNKTVVDPEFPRHGDNNLLFAQTFPQNCMKTRLHSSRLRTART